MMASQDIEQMRKEGKFQSPKGVISAQPQVSKVFTQRSKFDGRMGFTVYAYV
jgi:hypothetical protein